MTSHSNSIHSAWSNSTPAYCPDPPFLWRGSGYTRLQCTHARQGYIVMMHTILLHKCVSNYVSLPYLSQGEQGQNSNEKTSNLGPYREVLSNASGGIYACVPGIRDRVLARWPGWSRTMRELPMSLILAIMAEFNRTFLAERSLWTTGGLWLWRYANPLAMSASMDLLMARGMSGVFSSRSSRLVSSSSIQWRRKTFQIGGAGVARQYGQFLHYVMPSTEKRSRGTLGYV